MLESLVKLSLITMTSVRFNIFFVVVARCCHRLVVVQRNQQRYGSSVLFCHEANEKIRSDVSRAVSKGKRDPSPEPKVSLLNYLSKFTLSTTVTSASVDSK